MKPATQIKPACMTSHDTLTLVTLARLIASPPQHLHRTSTMFLDWISTLGFFEKDPGSCMFGLSLTGADQGVLLAFPIPTRSLIASHLADYLLKETTPITTLSTMAHVHLVLECVGQGFSLPIDNGIQLKK